jgi:hypothetical protein
LSCNQLSEEIRLVELDMRFEILIEAPAYATLISLEGRHHVLCHMQ